MPKHHSPQIQPKVYSKVFPKFTLSRSSTRSRPPSNNSFVPSSAFSRRLVMYLARQRLSYPWQDLIMHHTRQNISVTPVWLSSQLTHTSAGFKARIRHWIDRCNKSSSNTCAATKLPPWHWLSILWYGHSLYSDKSNQPSKRTHVAWRNLGALLTTSLTMTAISTAELWSSNLLVWLATKFASSTCGWIGNH